MNSEATELSPAQKWIRRLWRIVRVCLTLYLVLLLLMLFFENWLIFPAPRYPKGDWDYSHEDVFFESADGTKLHGVLVEHSAPKHYVLFCHGNGENVSYALDLAEKYRDDLQATVLMFDYRGYGRSAGDPHEKGVLADSHAAHEWFTNRFSKKPNEIVLIGRSLGGAVAVDLAAVHGAKGLVIQRTFSSMPDVAQRLYPIFPVRWLMKTQLNSASKIGKYDGPLLQSHGTADTLVKFDLGRKLFDAATTADKEFFEETHGGHNDGYSVKYWQKLVEFVCDLDDS